MDNTRFKPDEEARLKDLWKEIFKDSDAYVDLIFDRVLTPRYTLSHNVDGKLAAAIFGVPYEFVCRGKKLHALYLCGLSTRSEFRCRGIMTELINNLLAIAHDDSFPLVFLIPADNVLQRYYRGKGWNSAIYRVRERFTSLHVFIDKDKHNGLAEKYSVTRIENFWPDILTSGNIEFSNLVSDYVMKHETGKDYPVLVHDHEIMLTTICENSISGGTIFVAKNHKEDLVGIAFTMPNYEIEKMIEVRYIVSNSHEVETELLQKIHEAYPGHEITLFRFPEETDRKAICEEFNVTIDPDSPQSFAVGERTEVHDAAHNSETYGMAKILDVCEILKFMGVDADDEKYSILMKNPNMLQSVLFRHPKSDYTIEEAFGLRRLPLDMALLLD